MELHNERPRIVPFVSMIMMFVGGTITFAALAFVLGPRPELVADAEPLVRVNALMQRNIAFIFMPLLTVLGAMSFTGGALLWRGSAKGRRLLQRTAKGLMIWMGCMTMHQLFWMPTLARIVGTPLPQMIVMAVMLVMLATVVVILPMMMLLRRLKQDDIVSYCNGG